MNDLTSISVFDILHCNVMSLLLLIGVDVGNLFLTTFFLFFILLIALQVLGIISYGTLS
jgi:hypothetical protein